jgi:hypothetical protein
VIRSDLTDLYLNTLLSKVSGGAIAGITIGAIAVVAVVVVAIFCFVGGSNFCVMIRAKVAIGDGTVPTGYVPATGDL